MKIKSIVPAGLIILIVVGLGYQYSSGAPKEQARGVKIGVVSVRRIFESCKRNAEYRQQAAAEQDRVIAELEKLSKEIEAEQAGLRVLKPGSNDYLARMRELMGKQARLEAEQEFHKQQIGMKDQRWTEQLYADILKATDTIAAEKGLDLVFERDEIEFPVNSANELMMTIRTHKVLYSGGCTDITDEVITLLDPK
ncbi:MAG TPA: OmpH family outer membrane protein [Sedimentisphaerales bacterium]|nr:OmpH family outer membrane protein [Sedimentisphaerales bacterium]